MLGGSSRRYAVLLSSAAATAKSKTRFVADGARSSPWCRRPQPQQRKSGTTTKSSSSESAAAPPPPPSSTTTTATTTSTAPTTTTTASSPPKKGWWYSAELWGGLGATAGWGMSGSAIYDALQQGPEIISLTMTPVLIIYSALFVRWSLVIKPVNYFLAACHATNIVAQTNQLRRGLEYKMNGTLQQQAEVQSMMQQASIGGAAVVGSILAGPTIRNALIQANIGIVSTIAAADAGPFTVHFWAPMSKWMISGASFFDLHRPTDQISLAQYTALTLTGFFFSRYSLLVQPINYVLCSVNIALFGSSAWHLGRKIKADYIDDVPSTSTTSNPE